MTTPIATQGFFDPTKLLSLCQDRFEEKGGGETALLLGYGGHVNIQLQNVEEYAATIIDSPLLLNNEEKTGKEDNSTTKDAIDDDGGDTNDSIRSGVIQMAWHSINYSYYPDEGMPRWYVELDGELVGKDDEAVAALAVLSRPEHRLFDPLVLASLTLEKVEEIFEPAPSAGVLPMLADRARCLAEVGSGLLACGGFEALLQHSNGSAVAFANELVRLCPSFRDERTDDRGVVYPFMKRAQLCASMLHNLGVANFEDDLHRLTVFADYRIPQLFRTYGIFHYSGSLEHKVLLGSEKDGDVVLEGSSEEIDLRAGTLVAAELLRCALERRTKRSIAAAKLDYVLWRTAVDHENPFPFHKTRTLSY